MLKAKHRTSDDEAATRVFPDMPNHVDAEADFLAAVDKGVADLDAGRTKTAVEIAARFRRSNDPV